MSKQKVKKPHGIRHSIGLFFSVLLLVLGIVLNAAWGMFGGLVQTFFGAASPQVNEADKAATLSAAAELARQVEAEGMVLVQNRNDTLPLSASIKQVNVFGWASTAWLGGGSGSGGVSKMDVDLLRALSDYGIAYNTVLTDMYQEFQAGREYVKTLNSWPEQSCRLYEPDIHNADYYTQSMLDDAKAFSDTAIVVIGRLGGESNDCTKQQYKRVEKDGDIVVDGNRTSLEFSTEELSLLEYVGANYKNVVVLINSCNVMELGPVETISGIDACLITGLSGQNAATAIPAVLWGETEPSGRTADTWAYDLTTAASYANAGLEGVGAYTGAEGLYPFDGTTSGNTDTPFAYEQVSYTDYAEGIYIGYKWYETADVEGYWNDISNEYGKGYEGVVQYPFGYGMSYTHFDWEIIDAPAEGSTITKDSSISVTVKVTNTGSRAGKDVVQLYYAAPYVKGGIEKSAVELGAFAKTDLLEPGDSQALTLTFAAEDMASYDCYDANSNGFAGYELDAGNYTITVRSDAHTMVGTPITVYLAENVQYPIDHTTGAEVTNRFTGPDAVDGVPIDGEGSEGIVYMTRADFANTFPKSNTPSRPMAEKLRVLNLFDENQAATYLDDGDSPITTGAKNGLKIEENGLTTELGYQLGADFNDPQWDALLDQLTVEEMQELFVFGYGGTVELPSVGKMRFKDADGPAQIGGFTGMGAGTGFPSSSTLAQTWNASLAREEGRIIGQQAIQNGYCGWYAPAVNMHRSPFNGRNYEYYSEDSVLSGVLCGNTVQGASEAGVYTYVKHFICNDGESGVYRDSVYTWMTEQALREIYLEPFRTLVEDYDANGLMSSYNRIGAVWAGGSKALLTDVLRGEWGFHGGLITDYCDHHTFMNGDQSLRAGTSLWMSGLMGGEFVQETSSNSYHQALRRAAKEVLYMTLHVRVTNRNYSETAGDVSIIRPAYKESGLGIIQPLIYVVIALGVALIALCIRFLVIDHKLRKELKAQQ